jgi:hypothetical protein
MAPVGVPDAGKTGRTSEALGSTVLLTVLVLLSAPIIPKGNVNCPAKPPEPAFRMDCRDCRGATGISVAESAWNCVRGPSPGG